MSVNPRAESTVAAGATSGGASPDTYSRTRSSGTAGDGLVAHRFHALDLGERGQSLQQLIPRLRAVAAIESSSVERPTSERISASGVSSASSFP